MRNRLMYFYIMLKPKPETIIEKKKMLMLYFWSHNGTHILSTDLGFDLFIGQHIILFPQNYFKTGLAIPTTSEVMVSQHTSPVFSGRHCGLSQLATTCLLGL